MRLLTRRIYRAFPELDAYDDAQCIRFVRSARRGLAQTILHPTAILLVAVPSIAAGLYASGWLYDFLAGREASLLRRPFVVEAVWALLSLLMLALGVAMGLWTRDLLLRRRLRHILRKRGVCPACHYSLIGLAVSDSSTVLCPECGIEIEVDASLAELSKDQRSLLLGATGRIRREPGQSMVDATRWTPKRKRLVWRISIAAAIVLVVLPGAGWASYEWWLASQAARARADHATYLQRLAALDPVPPSGSPQSQRNGWSALSQATTTVNSIDDTMWRSHLGMDPQAVPPNFWRILRTQPPQNETPEGAQIRIAESNMARQVIKAYLAAGLAANAREFAAATYAIKPPDAPMPDGGQWSFQGVTAVFTPVRVLHPVLTGWEAIAEATGDDASAFEATEAILSLARFVSDQPLAIGSIYSYQLHTSGLNIIRRRLMSTPDQATVDKLAAILDRQPFAPRPDLAIESTRLFTLTQIAAVFEDVSTVRFGRFSYARKQDPRVPVKGVRLGTYSENTAVLSQLFDEAASNAGRPAFARALHTPSPLVWELMPVAQWAPNLSQYIELYSDRSLAEVGGLRAMIALERFRLAHADYPNSLQELTPALLDTLPIDPWSGKPLVYRKIDPATDPHKRPYLLYAVGPDLSDDGGLTTNPGFQRGGGFSAGAATDFVLNAPQEDH